MPAKKGSKKLIVKQSLLGLFQKNKKLIINMEQKKKETREYFRAAQGCA